MSCAVTTSRSHAPSSWPDAEESATGRDFLGTYDLFADALLLFERGVHDRVVEPVRCSGLDDPVKQVLYRRSRARATSSSSTPMRRTAISWRAGWSAKDIT